ncbi:TBC domain-containing protein [Hypoxylon fuscum]|nr:TBC domain-containing protein [Hypoxylon fuscum]
MGTYSELYQQRHDKNHEDSRGVRQFIAGGGLRSGPGSDVSSAGVGVGVRPERGFMARGGGIHVARVQGQDSKHTPVRRTNFPNAEARHKQSNRKHKSNEDGYDADEDIDYNRQPILTTTYSPSSFWTPSTTTANSTPTTNLTSYSSHSSPVPTVDDSSPCVPISPRWDSLAYDRSATLSPTSPTFSSSQHSRASNGTDELHIPIGTRDAFPVLSTAGPKMNTTETVYVDNFSRPRKPSIRQPHLHDHIRFPPPPPNHPPPEPDHSDTIPDHSYSWQRKRGPSVSSDMSAATFASVPARPPVDMYGREHLRSRGRQQNPPVSRPPGSYRAESSGPTFTREPLPRMASAPNDELRTSYRSQLSASTGQGTAVTERSSIATKSSSITSVYGVVDDNLSIDDMLGMYEQGFADSAPEDNDSRPPTAISEDRKRRTRLLEAMNDLLPKSDSDLAVPMPTANSVVRDSTAIFHDPGMRDSLPMEIPEESPEEVADITPEESSENTHVDPDIGIDNDSDDEVFPPPSRAPTNLTIGENDDERDRYGFRKSNQYVSREQYDSWNQGYSEYLARRRKKWNAFLREHGLMTDNANRFPPRSNKTKRFVRKGIPPDWRGAAWFYYAGGPAVLAKHPGMYDSLLKQTAKEVDIEAIERDLHRTFPDNVRFRSFHASAPEQGNQPIPQEGVSLDRADERAMIASLRRVLLAFSIYNPRIGYCQSLNFLAGLLLLFVETEEHAFWLLNIITRVYLPGTHEMSLEGANVDLGVLMSSLREAMPAVWAKIGGELDGTDAAWPLSFKNRHKAEPIQLPPITLCMTAWFMSCFIGTLPIESVLRVWDVFFYEGSKTLFRIALAVFKIGESEIKAVTDPMEIFQVVQTIPRRLIDANALMEACFKRRNGFGHLSQETVEQKRQERRNQVKAERERLEKNDAGGGVDMKKKGTLFGRHKDKGDVV